MMKIARSRMNKACKLWTILLMIVAMGLVSPVADAISATYHFAPVDDAMVRSTDPDLNFGNYDNIAASGVSVTDWNFAERSFLKFDLAGADRDGLAIPDNERILSMDIYLYCTGSPSGGPDASRTVDMHWVGFDNSWQEDSITWNTKPGYDAVAKTSHLFPDSYTGWVKWDDPALVQGGHDSTVSYMIRLEQESGWLVGYHWHVFRSSEYADESLRPYIEVTTEVVPIPAAAWLLGPGLVGLFGVKRKFRI